MCNLLPPIVVDISYPTYRDLHSMDCVLSKGVCVMLGISTGNVFCGIVGSDQRRAFDILGDPVNLSCRLMQLCGETRHSFLCDEVTSVGCGGRFLFSKQPQAYKMKGQSAPLPVYTVEQCEEFADLGLDLLRKRLQVYSTVVCGRHQQRVCFTVH